jgi:tRNA G18 (ribose-2'-O)-methylase SpoU
MTEIQHVRYKELSPLERPRELVLACPPLRSNVNLSRIVRLASCCGIRKMYVCGKPKIDRSIARDGVDQIEFESHRSLPPVLEQLKRDGYRLVGLEQTDRSHNLHTYSFVRKTALVIGHERSGLTEDLLKRIDDAVEIPVYGLPYSYNVATAVTMALYEYCRQFPVG